MAASMRTLALLGLVMAAFCVAADATAVESGSRKLDLGVGLKVKLAVKVNLNLCYHDIRVYVGLGATGQLCPAKTVTVLKPVTTTLVVANLVYVDLEILGVKVAKVRVVIDLTKATLIGDVYNIVLDCVEDVKTKQLTVLFLGVKLTVLDLVKLGVVVLV